MRIYKKNIVVGTALITLLVGSASCQRASVAPPPAAYQAIVTQPRLLIVKGQLFKGLDTLNSIRKCRVIFSSKLPDNRIESVYDTVSMPATGHYRVRLRANQSYQAALVAGGRSIEVHEFDTPASISDSVLIHDFRLGYE